MNSIPRIDDIISEADAALDAEAKSAMNAVNDRFGPEVKAMQGKLDDDAIEDAAEVLVLTIVVDDSLSITTADNAENVRYGHNSILRALQASQQAETVLVGCRYFNDGVHTRHHVLYPYVDLEDASYLNESNYQPMGGTALFDQAAIALTASVNQMEAILKTGTPARAVTVIISDGDDQHSEHNTADDVAAIVRGQLRKENHIIAAIGIPNADGPVDFRQIFSSMGILDQWILTPDSSDSDIRHAFNTVTDTAILGNAEGGALDDLDGMDDEFDSGQL